MSSARELVMPQLGQAMEFGTVAEWLVPDGTEVKAGQPVVSVESDKATYELEAAVGGILRHVAEQGAEVLVGKPLATIGDTATPATTDVAQIAAASSEVQKAAEISTPASAAASAPSGRVAASPKAKALAKQLGVDLATVTASRADGMIVEQDVEAAAKTKAAPMATAAAPSTPASRLKRIAADRLSRSWQQAPHIVQMIEVDATRLAAAQGAIKTGQLAATLNDVLIKAAADALANNPKLNAVWRDGQLAPLPDISIGLAVATDAGLTVPVVRGADKLSLPQIAKATQALVAAARDNKLTREQIGRAGATISNLGRYGIAFGTPVLNLDEPILIFIGAIEDRVIAREGRALIRLMTTVSIAYDHRVADGIEAAAYSQAFKNALETLEISDVIARSRDTARSGQPNLASDASASAQFQSPPVYRGSAREAGEGDGHQEPAPRTLLATSTGGGLAISIRSGKHLIAADEPLAAGGTDSGPDPVSLTLTGLVSCLIVALKLTAQHRNILLERVEGRLTATPKGKVKEIAIALDVWTTADEATMQGLLTRAKTGCTVHDMLRPDFPLTTNLTVHPPVRAS